MEEEATSSSICGANPSHSEPRYANKNHHQRAEIKAQLLLPYILDLKLGVA